MRLLLVVLVLTVVFANLECEGKKKEGPAEIKKFFDNLFKKGGKKAFKNFVKESKKIAEMGKGKQEDEEEDPKAKKDEDDDEDEITPSAKSFVFYTKTFGCPKSKVYESFLKKVKDGEYSDVKTEETIEDRWLQKMAKEKEKETEGGGGGVSVDDAKDSLKELSKDEMRQLQDSEAESPLAAQVFLKFIKKHGCENKNLEKFEAFHQKFKEETAKRKKKTPMSYFISKAEVIGTDLMAEE